MEHDSAGRRKEASSPGGAAVPCSRYRDVTTHEGELIVYDVDVEDAWIQADRYDSLDARV